MSTGVVAGIVSLCVATTGLVVANLLLTMMIGDINRRRTDAERISYFGFTYPKISLIFREYRRLYPNRKLHVFAGGSFALAVLGLISAAIKFRIVG